MRNLETIKIVGKDSFHICKGKIPVQTGIGKRQWKLKSFSNFPVHADFQNVYNFIPI